MEKVQIEVNLREKKGKEIAKKLRKKGEVPGVVYGKGVNESVSIPLSSLKVLRGINFSESTIIDMKIVPYTTEETLPVLVKDVQYSPLTEAVIHIDFMKVSLEEKIRVRIPITFKGEPQGVKEGAVVEYVLREVEIEGYPLDVPARIELDISGLQMGHSLHVKDLVIDEKLKMLTHLDETLAVLASKTEEEPEPAEGEQAPVEPEVIKEKKEEKEEKKDKKEGEEKSS